MNRFETDSNLPKTAIRQVKYLAAMSPKGASGLQFAVKQPAALAEIGITERLTSVSATASPGRYDPTFDIMVSCNPTLTLPVPG